MLSIDQARELLAVVVPVYFDPSVEEGTIRGILEGTFSDQALFCRLERTLLVVDRDTRAEAILKNAAPGSSFYNLPLSVLEQNRGKAGAVRSGLAQLLETTSAPYLVTRDCDGDHAAEDLARIVSLAQDIHQDTGKELISVFGVRPSLEKPMGWLREQWEFLINKVFEDVAEFLLAQKGKVLDKRYWNGYPLDAQSGYRLYTRGAAQRAVQCLASVPDEKELLTFACEILPFLALALEGAAVGQVQRLTLVEQPVSSYCRIALSRVYGGLLAYIRDCYDIPASVLLQIFDNHLVASSLYFTDFRSELLECRRRILADAPPPLLPRFL